jgi:hypothetical protein
MLLLFGTSTVFSCIRSGKRKSGRSSVSSRSREGGSLPPTKFENVVLCSSSSSSSGGGCGAQPAPLSLAWDSGGPKVPIVEKTTNFTLPNLPPFSSFSNLSALSAAGRGPASFSWGEGVWGAVLGIRDIFFGADQDPRIRTVPMTNESGSGSNSRWHSIFSLKN